MKTKLQPLLPVLLRLVTYCVLGLLLFALFQTNGEIATRAEVTNNSLSASPDIASHQMSIAASDDTEAIIRPSAGNETETLFQEPQRENVELVSYMGGPSYAITVDNGYAYVGEGLYLTVLDVSDPTNPTVMGRSEPFSSQVQDIAVMGDYAYVVAFYGGLQILDVSNPTTPTKVGTYDVLGDDFGVDVVEPYAYVASGYGGLTIIDVSDPTAPFEVGESTVEVPEYARRVQVIENYAYVIGGGLRIIDVSDPTSLTETGAYEHSANAAYVVGDYAYIAHGGTHKTFSWGGLQIVDVSDPSEPTKVGDFDALEPVHGVFTAGNYAYIAAESGIRVIDVSDPTSPTEAGSLDTPDIPQDVQTIGSYAYVTGYGGFRTVDISDPITPQLVSFYDTLGSTGNLSLVGQYAFLKASNGRTSSLRILDMSNPLKPYGIGSYYAPGGMSDFYATEDYAYVTWGRCEGSYYDPTCYYGLDVVDISAPVSPVKVGFLDLTESVGDVFVAGDYAYLAGGSGSLRVVDIADPTSPEEVGAYKDLEYSLAVFVVGDYAYIASRTKGLHMLDISDPTAPYEVGAYESTYAYEVFVVDGYAYIAAAGSDLVIVDISDPAAPTEAGSISGSDPHWWVEDVYVSGDYAYVTDGVAGTAIRVIDISDLSALKEVGFHNTTWAGWAADLSIADGYIFATYTAGELLVLKFTCYDLNQDGKVGMVEVQAVADCWHEQSDDPDWDECSQFDSDGNGIIDITDIARVAAAWGPWP